MHQLKKLSRAIITGVVVTAGLSACSSLNVFSDTASTDVVSSQSEQASATVWQSGHQYVKLVNKGRGSAQNDHPIKLSSAEVKGLLESVYLSGGFIIKSQEQAVFSAGELQILSATLSKVLAEARVDEDITFASIGLHSGAFGKEKKSTSGRVFVKDGQLHIIFGLLHDENTGPLIEEGETSSQTAHLVAGIRLAEEDLNSSLALQSGQTFHRDPKTGDKREDWLVIDIDTLLASQAGNSSTRGQQVSSALLKDVAQSKKEADNIRDDISKMKEVLFELTDDVQQLKQEIEALKQRR